MTRSNPLRFDSATKHMKIEQSADPRKFYLFDGRTFNSIPELVIYYRHNSLAESFQNLDTCLKGTLLKGSVYRAIHDYQPRNPEDPKYLMLSAGDVVTVVDCSGEANGWWKGKVSDRVGSIQAVAQKWTVILSIKIGFFPITYVKRLKGQADEDEAASVISASCSLSSLGIQQALGNHVEQPAFELRSTSPNGTRTQSTPSIPPMENESFQQRNYYSSHFPSTTPTAAVNGSVLS